MKQQTTRILFIAPATLGALFFSALVPALTTQTDATAQLDHSIADSTFPASPKVDQQKLQASAQTEVLEELRKRGKRQAAKAAYELAILAEQRQDAGVAEKLFAEAAILEPENTQYLWAASRSAFSVKNYKSTETFLYALLAKYRAMPEQDQTNVIPVLDDLAALYRTQNLFKASRSALRESLRLQQQVFGNNHPKLIGALYRLAELEITSANLGEAKSYLSEIDRILKSPVEKVETRDIAAIYHNIGELYRVNEQFELAESSYQKAMEYWNTAPDRFQESIARTQRSLNRLHARKAQLESLPAISAESAQVTNPQSAEPLRKQPPAQL